MNSTNYSSHCSLSQQFQDIDITNNTFNAKQKTKSAQFYLNNTDALLFSNNQNDTDNSNSIYSVNNISKLITPQHNRSRTMCNENPITSSNNKDFKIFGKKKKNQSIKTQENKNPNIINYTTQESDSKHKIINKSNSGNSNGKQNLFFTNNNNNNSIISSISGKKNQIMTVEDSQETLLIQHQQQIQTNQLQQHQQMLFQQQQQQQQYSGSVPNTFKTEPNTLSKIEQNLESQNIADYNITSFNEKSSAEDCIFGENASFAKFPQQSNYQQNSQQLYDLQMQKLQLQQHQQQQLQQKQAISQLIISKNQQQQQEQQCQQDSKINLSNSTRSSNYNANNNNKDIKKSPSSDFSNHTNNNQQLNQNEEEQYYNDKLSNLHQTPVPLEQMRLTTQKRLANSSNGSVNQHQSLPQSIDSTQHQQSQSNSELLELSQNNLVFMKFIEIINKRFEQLERKLDGNSLQNTTCICGQNLLNNASFSGCNNKVNNLNQNNNNNNNNNMLINNNNNDNESILTASISVTGKKTVVNEDLKRSSQQNNDQFSQTYLPVTENSNSTKIIDLENRIKNLEQGFGNYQNNLEKRLKEYKLSVEHYMNKFVDMSFNLNEKLDKFNLEKSLQQQQQKQPQNSYNVEKIVHDEEYNILNRRITNFNEELNLKIKLINENMEQLKKTNIENGKIINEDRKVLKSFEDDFCRLLNLYKECNEQIGQSKWLSDEIQFLKQRQIQTLNLIKRLSEQINMENSNYDIQ